MTFNLNIIKKLKKAGYVELNPDTPQTGVIAHVVYLTNDEDGDKLYFQSTRAIRHVFGKFNCFLKYGHAKYLPIPVQKAMTWSHVQFGDLHVKAFYRKDIFLNHELERKLANEFTVVGRSERNHSKPVDVLKLSIEGVPGYKIVTTRNRHSTAVAQFVSKSKELITATYDVQAIAHRKWAIENRLRLSSANIKVEVLAEGLAGGPAGMFMQLALDSETNPELLLNARGV